MALVTFGFLIGAILSVRFNVVMLGVAIGLAVVGTGTVGIAQGNRVEAVLLTVALVATAAISSDSLRARQPLHSENALAPHS